MVRGQIPRRKKVIDLDGGEAFITEKNLVPDS